jgi:hypothetical protein
VKVSELIAKLEEILRTEGDLPVTCWENDGQVSLKDVESAEVEEDGGCLYVAEKQQERKVVHIDTHRWTGSTP